MQHFVHFSQHFIVSHPVHSNWFEIAEFVPSFPKKRRKLRRGQLSASHGHYLKSFLSERENRLLALDRKHRISRNSGRCGVDERICVKALAL